MNPKLTPSVLIPCFSLLTVVSVFGSGGESIYNTTKTAVYVQTSGSSTVASPKFPYNFDATAVTSATLTLPGGSSAAIPLTNSGYELIESFVTKAALDTAYPDGTYQMAGTGIPTLTFNLTPDSYPSAIPSLTNGTWNNNVLYVNPGANVTLDFSNFAGYGTVAVGSFMSLTLQDIEGSGSKIKQQVISATNSLGIPQSASPFTSYTISSGQLVSGDIYELDLQYANALSFNTTIISGTGVVTLFQNEMVCYVVALASSSTPPPVIASDLTNETGVLGGKITLSASVTSGGAPISGGFLGLWYLNGQEINIDGVKYSTNGTSLTINSLVSADAGIYFAKFINQGGLAISAESTLTVNSSSSAPSFSTSPGSQKVVSGTTVVFNSAATGTPAPTYQWNLNGSAIPGATSARLVVSGTTVANAGTYTCVATNAVGSVTSSPATLTIDSTPADIANPGRLINLSVNTFDGTGTQAMTVGFTTGGLGSTGTQTLLIRASGPALTPYYGSAVLPDPTLTLYDHTAAVVVTNAGWGTPASNETAVIAADAATGAFSLTNANSLDSAVVETLPGNLAYTVAVSGKSGDTGQTIAEVYDDTATGTYTATTPRLINLSCRIQVGATSTLTAGFVVGGATSKSVLVRASGPALAGLLSGTMPDPQLALFTGSTKIASNAGWGGDPQLTAAMTAVYAFVYTNAASKDSALLVTLPPGSYTAQASSVGGNAGITLVEVYEVP